MAKMLITLCKGPSGEEVGKSERSDEIPVRARLPVEIRKKALSLPPVRDVAQLVSVLGLGPRGPPFESEYPDKRKADGESAFLRIRRSRRYFFAMFSRISVSAWMFLNL